MNSDGVGGVKQESDKQKVEVNKKKLVGTDSLVVTNKVLA